VHEQVCLAVGLIERGSRAHEVKRALQVETRVLIRAQRVERVEIQHDIERRKQRRRNQNRTKLRQR